MEDFSPNTNLSHYRIVAKIGGLRQVIRLMPDSRAIAYMEMKDGVSNIWTQQIAGGQPRQLTNFTSGESFCFDLARDAKPSLFSRGTIIKDVVVISNFKQ